MQVDTSKTQTNVSNVTGDLALYGARLDRTEAGDLSVSDSLLHITNSILNATGDISLFGAFADSDTAAGNHTVTGNTLNIGEGTNLNANDYIMLVGGVAYVNYDTGTQDVTKNTVTLRGKINVTAGGAVNLAGGWGVAAAPDTPLTNGDFRTGNTLILDQATVALNAGGVGTSTVSDFQNYIFGPSYENIMNNTPMLKANTITLGAANNARLSFSTIPGDTRVIPTGTEFTLMQADPTELTDNFANIGDTHSLNPQEGYVITTGFPLPRHNSPERLKQVTGRLCSKYCCRQWEWEDG